MKNQPDTRLKYVVPARTRDDGSSGVSESGSEPNATPSGAFPHDRIESAMQNIADIGERLASLKFDLMLLQAEVADSRPEK